MRKEHEYTSGDILMSRQFVRLLRQIGEKGKIFSKKILNYVRLERSGYFKGILITI